jgi:hypothetical protein
LGQGQPPPLIVAEAIVQAAVRVAVEEAAVRARPPEAAPAAPPARAPTNALTPAPVPAAPAAAPAAPAAAPAAPVAPAAAPAPDRPQRCAHALRLLLRFLDVPLIAKLVLFGAIFSQGASPARAKTIATLAAVYYAFSVGLFAAVATQLARAGAHVLGERRALAAATIVDPAAFVDVASDAMAGWGRGYVFCDVLALVASFVFSLLPTWQPEARLRARVLVAPPQAQARPPQGVHD